MFSTGLVCSIGLVLLSETYQWISIELLKQVGNDTKHNSPFSEGFLFLINQKPYVQHFAAYYNDVPGVCRKS